MPRACSICTHSDRYDIEKSLVNGISYRTIAAQFAVSASAVTRHKSEHLPQLLAGASGTLPVPQRPPKRDTVPVRETTLQAHVDQVASNNADHAVDILCELFTQLEQLGKLYQALDAWLTDPSDPTGYSIAPRADEIVVVYEDYADCIGEGKPRRKRSTLAHLLQHVCNESAGAVQPISGETKYADPRELLVKVSAELRAQMQLRVTIVEKLENAQEIERFKAAVLDAVGEVDPHVRRAVEDNLRRRQPLRGLTGLPVR